MARVSVIISTYNRKDLLKKAIRSVLNQSFPDFELLIVDDCSDQDVKKLALSFGDPRIQYFRTEKNNGHDGPVKNLGLKHATGEYVSFLDDDDQYRPDALKILTTYADEAGADVVYGDYLIDGKIGWSIDFTASGLSKMNYISMCSAMVRRSSINAVGGFDEAVPKFKDWNLWIRLQKNGGLFMHVPIITTEVFSQKESVSGKFKNDTDEAGRYKPTFFNPADCRIYPDKTSLGERPALKVAIYTLTMNRLEYTKRMYKAIDTLAGYPFDWYVIDQGSNDGTVEFLKNETRDRVQHNDSKRGFWREKLRYRLYEKNVGLSKGWNNAIDFIKQEGKYDIVIKIDNDAELMTEGWLAAMIDLFERNRRIILSPYVEGLDGSPGGVLRQRASGQSPYMTINDRILGLVPNLGGIVFATPIELFNEWKFDDNYQGNKDFLLSQYAHRLGYQLFYMEEFRVWHIDGTKGQQKKYPDYFKGRPDVEETEEKDGE